MARAPLADLAQGLAEYPGTERDDQVRLLGERDELAGGEQAAVRMLPAHERLDAEQLTA